MTTLRTYQWLSIFFFIGTLIINYLANALPIGGHTTAEVSDLYPNLFTPANYTFSVWGGIYLALGVYVWFQARSLFKNSVIYTDEVINKIAPWFILSCIANMLWIIVWQYLLIEISLLVMGILLYSLIRIVSLIYQAEVSAHLIKKIYFKLPFGLYIGWIMVATIANVAAYLSHIQWSGFGLSEPFWTGAMMVIASIIAIYTIFRVSNIYIGLTVIWGILGIVYQRFAMMDSQPYNFLPYLGMSCMLAIAIGMAFASQLPPTNPKNA